MALPSPAPGRTAVVTGASSGIGADLARELHRRGHHVTLVARREAELRTLAAELGGDARAHVLPVDLADRDARAALPDALRQAGLEADVLVNNAGFGTTGPVSGADVDDEVRMVEVDVTAVVDLTTRLVPGLVERGGALLNVASTAAFQPMPGQAAYAASKAFVLSYTQALAAELRGRVSVTALCPGPVRTGFAAAAGVTDEEAEKALPGVFWVDAAEVARAAVDGLARGRTVVVPGAANKVGSVLAQVAPRSVLLPVLAKGHPALKGR